jgi:hypothetical protein
MFMNLRMASHTQSHAIKQISNTAICMMLDMVHVKIALQLTTTTLALAVTCDVFQLSLPSREPPP